MVAAFGPFAPFSPAAAMPAPAPVAPAVAADTAPGIGPELPVNAPIPTLTGTDASASDGTNHLVVWMESNRYGRTDLAGARVSADGALLDVNGFTIAPQGTAFTQANPAVAFDGTNYLVVWQRWPELYVYESDIYGVRVSPSGAVLGEPFVIASGPAHQAIPKVAFNGTDYVVAWSAIVDPAWAVFVARVTPSGVVRDPAGIAMPTAGSETYLQGVASNASSTLVVWTQTTDAGHQIAAARVTSTGTVPDPAGIVVSSEFTSYHVAVAVVGPNFMVGWNTGTPAEGTEIRAGRVSPDGTLLDGNGFVVASTSAWTDDPSIAFDGTNALIVWRQNDGPDEDIYGARVTPAGAVLDPTARPIVVGDDADLRPMLSYGGAGFLLLWTSPSVGGVRGMVLTNYEPPPTGGVVIARQNVASHPDLAFDGSNYLVVWKEASSTDSAVSRIRASRVSPSGTPLDGEGILVATTASPWYPDGPSVSFDGTNFLVVWSDVRGDGSSIYGARINRGGAVLDPDGLVISQAASTQTEPAVAFDGANHLVVWEDALNGDPAIWAKRVAPDGSMTAQIPIAWASGSQRTPDVASDGTTSLIVWEDTQTGNPDINSIRIRRTGGPIGPDGRYADPTGPGVPISSAPGPQQEPSVTWNGERYLTAWTDQRAAATGDIYASRVTRGNVVQDPAGFVVSDAPDDQTQPITAANGAMFLVVWTDRRSGTGFDTYGARVDGNGAVRDGAGFAIAAGLNPEIQPAVVKGSGTNWGVVWMRSRPTETDGNGILFMREVSPK